MNRKRLVIGTVAATLALFAGLGVAASLAAEKITLNALVASSSKPPYEELVASFEKSHPGVTVETEFLGGGQIGKAIDDGKAADIVLVGSAILAKESGLVEPVTPIYNTKDIVITPKKNPAKVKSLKDLANPGVKISIGTPASAVGAISAGILQKAAADYGFDFIQKVHANITFQSEVGQEVVDAVSSGKADAAIVFVTDGDTSKFDVYPIEDKYNTTSYYQGTVTKNAKNAKLGEEFVKLMASKAGQAVFAKHRYLPPTMPPAPK
jgi:molybdate transport system substrate-binding protein